MEKAIEILTEPEFEPVSITAMRAWFRIDTSDHDAILALLAKAMREQAEHYTGRAFIQRDYRLYLSEFPVDKDYSYRVVLPVAPVRSVDAFRYRDADGTLQTLSANDYVLHAYDSDSRAFIVPSASAGWPGLQAVPDAVQIDFTAGYPSGSPADEDGQQEFVPAILKLWMEATANTLNEFREQLVTGSVMEVPREFSLGLLDSLIVRNRFA